MGLITDYERIKAGRKLKDWKDTLTVEIKNGRNILSLITNNQYGAINEIVKHCQMLIDKASALKTDYPTDISEIDGYITKAQTALNKLKSDYVTQVYNKVTI